MTSVRDVWSIRVVLHGYVSSPAGFFTFTVLHDQGSSRALFFTSGVFPVQRQFLIRNLEHLEIDYICHCFVILCVQ